jgi:hypothetical protein
MSKAAMTGKAAARIQSGAAKAQGYVSKGSFPARAQSAAARNNTIPARPAGK